MFCFYMSEKPELLKSFQEISAITGMREESTEGEFRGRREVLSKYTGGKATLFNNTKILIDIVAETVLDDIGGNQMVLEYRKTYHS